MFEDLLASLTNVDPDIPDAQRVELLTALERVEAVCAAMQARVTVDLAESQEQVAQAWRQRAKECAAEGDFEAWVAARDEARPASVPESRVTAPRSGPRSRAAPPPHDERPRDRSDQ